MRTEIEKTKKKDNYIFYLARKRKEGGEKE